MATDLLGLSSAMRPFRDRHFLCTRVSALVLPPRQAGKSACCPHALTLSGGRRDRIARNAADRKRRSIGIEWVQRDSISTQIYLPIRACLRHPLLQYRDRHQLDHRIQREYSHAEWPF